MITHTLGDPTRLLSRFRKLSFSEMVMPPPPCALDSIVVSNICSALQEKNISLAVEPTIGELVLLVL